MRAVALHLAITRAEALTRNGRGWCARQSQTCPPTDAISTEQPAPTAWHQGLREGPYDQEAAQKTEMPTLVPLIHGGTTSYPAHASAANGIPGVLASSESNPGISR
jgi:hypothetical protein